MKKQYYAHSLEGEPPEKWQLLEEHLKNVARMAGDFARPFGGENWAGLAGLWHDLGKYSLEFQDKLYRENGYESHLETRPGRVVHSEAGGHLAVLKGGAWKQGADRVLSWLIMGHHAGLTDYEPEYIRGRALLCRMEHPDRSREIIANAPAWLVDQRLPSPPALLREGADPALFIRMLFSCVVDADFLDTEAFMDRDRSALRNRSYPGMGEFLRCFDGYMDRLCARAAPTPVNAVRADVLAWCRKAAESEPAVFSLSVPTGGGKTLSSLAFALRHAMRFRKDRIIYVIPYTSIIEQTADVFRKIPGLENAVVEHHSNIAETDESRETVRSRLAAENWDAPLVVTTSVQFFESLYACRTSRCRKLHNIANSVVIFDEAQCLPPAFLRPSVYMIRELFRHYRVTPLLCTATQPVLTRTESFDFRFREGFDSVTEIIPDPVGLAGRLQRVEVRLHRRDMAPVTLPELAESLLAEGKPALCIVNRRDDARTLARLLPGKQTLHLSTNMCARHRADVLDEVRRRLSHSAGPFVVVSTSLVEAGVDIDFPVVYRALAGLDSIAQAAGRCNREGRLRENGKNVFGRTVVFVPDTQPGYVRQPAGITMEMLRPERLGELLSPESYDRYFRQRFWQLGADELDKNRIMQCFDGPMNYYFRTAAERFRLIDDGWQENVIVPYGEALDILARLTGEPWNQRRLFRRLGRYSVGIPRVMLEELAAREYVRESGYPGLFMLDQVLYDMRYGFVPPDEATDIDPELFMM